MAQLFSLGIMDTPIATKPPKRRIMALIWILASLALTILSLLSITSAIHQFYLDTATLAPGTGIRPMGMEMGVGLTWTASILIGGSCALVGLIIALKQRRWVLVSIAVLAGVLSWVPMFAAGWGIDHVVTLRKLVMEP